MCWLAWANRHEVYPLYRLFRQVIGRWLSLLNSPGLGIKVVLPSENHKGNWRSSSWAVAWKQVAISLCKIVTFFHQKLAIRSRPGALQFFFLLRILVTCSAFEFQPSVGTSSTTSSIASPTSSIHFASVSPLPSSRLDFSKKYSLHQCWWTCPLRYSVVSFVNLPGCLTFF